jgi:hypothetical protein
VTVQVNDEVFDATARTVTDEAERARLWPELTKIWPDYDKYQARTDRKIPVVVLAPSLTTDRRCSRPSQVDAGPGRPGTPW